MPWLARSLAFLMRALTARPARPAGPKVAIPPVTEDPAGEIGPEPVAAAAAEGDRLRDSGEWAAAAACYTRALGLAPERTDLRVQLGNMLKDSGMLAEAETAYRQAIAERPGDADVHVQLGHLCKLLGRRQAAFAAYRRALALDPHCAPAVIELADMGEAEAQAQNFQAQLRAGGVDALLTLGQQLEEIRAKLDRMARQLPDLTGRVAFPIALYSLFRESFAIPAPPPRRDTPHFTIILPADREPLDTLQQQLLGVRGQVEAGWTLIAVGRDATRCELVGLAAAGDARIRWCHAAAPDAAAECQAAGSVAGGWIVFLAAGAVLDRHALGWFAAAAELGAASAYVADEEIGEAGRGHVARAAPALRQVVDHDTLLECNPYGETIAVRAEVYAAIAPLLTTATIAAQRSLLLLTLAREGRVGHVPYPLVWRCADGEAASDQGAAHAQAVRAHLAATGLPVEMAGPGAEPRWVPPVPAASLAVIIATRDNAGDVRNFVDTLAMTADRPEDLAIVVIDNGSQDAVQLRILAEIGARPGVLVLPDDQPFNWSRLNNRAAAQADASLLVFANDDMRMVSVGWDTILRGLLGRAEIGAVGARLLYDDDTVQHAGVLFGWRGSVIHDGLFEPAGRAGPCCRWHVTRAVGAVTGAFLAIRRDVFQSHGGFDEEGLPVAYSDIDLALKLRASGLRILFTPRITLVHHESKSRGLDHLDSLKSSRNRAERFVMERRWGAALESDPGLNPIWRDATLPFRLIAAPSAARVQDHIMTCGSPLPWLPIMPTRDLRWTSRDTEGAPCKI